MGYLLTYGVDYQDVDVPAYNTCAATGRTIAISVCFPIMRGWVPRRSTDRGIGDAGGVIVLVMIMAIVVAILGMYVVS